MRGDGSSRTWFGLLVVTALAACSPAVPTRTDASLPAPATDPTGAEVVVEAGGRFACDWVVGCGAFIEIVPIQTLPIAVLPDDWEPERPYLLATTAAADAPPVAFDVGPPDVALPRLGPGTYRVVAGIFWVDDSPSQEPGTFPASVVPSPCVAPLVVGEATVRATVAARFEADGVCAVTTSPAPAATSAPGVELVVELDGKIGCNAFPYGCLAKLSVLPAGTDVGSSWRPSAEDTGWAPAAMGDDTLDPTPYRPIPTLAPGASRLVVSLLGSYDTPSYAPDGSISTDLLARCILDVEVDPATGPVTVRVTFTPDGISFGGTCAIERVD